MPSPARSSSADLRRLVSRATRDRPPVTSTPARSAKVSNSGLEPLVEEAVGEPQVVGQVLGERDALAVRAREPARRAGCPSHRHRRRFVVVAAAVPRERAGCRRTASGGSGSSSTDGSGHAELRPDAWRAGGTTRRSRGRDSAGRPSAMADRQHHRRPASCSSSASWTPVCPDPTMRTPPGGSCPGSGSRARGAGAPLRSRGGRRDLRGVERAGRDDHVVGVDRACRVSRRNRRPPAPSVVRRAPRRRDGPAPR